MQKYLFFKLKNKRLFKNFRGMEMAINKNFPNLTSTIQMGPHLLRNRTVIPAHTMGYLTEEGTVGKQYIEYLKRRAAGGAAIVGMGSAPVHPSSFERIMQPWLWKDSIIDGLAKAAQGVQDEGSLLCMMLWHSGHNASHYSEVVPLAPSPVPSIVTDEIPKEMSKEDIKEIVDAFRDAAIRCVKAGVDVIEVQTSSDYLLGSFMSPRLNRRNDSYGGSLENRCRITMEILESIREVSDKNTAISVRTSVEHLIPGDPEGYGMEDSLSAMKLIAEKNLVDWISLMTSSHWNFNAMMPSMQAPRNILKDQSAVFKQELNIPIVVSTRIKNPYEAEDILSKGQADAVAMVRPFIADPDWMIKVEEGKIETIRPCIACNQGCLGNAIRGIPSTCSINPMAGHEHDWPKLEKASKKLNIAIVGGGPAGLEAARIASKREHSVSLYEKNNELGGAMRLAGNVPHRSEILEAINWWHSELKRLGVRIFLNKTITQPDSLNADKIIWATGAKPSVTHVWRNRPQLFNGIPGTKKLPHGREILSGTKEAHGNVLIIDEESGWPAVSLVEHLNSLQNVEKITVTTDRLIFGMPDLQFTTELGIVAQRLASEGIVIHTNTLVSQVENNIAITTSNTKLGPFDSIILSMGSMANKAPDNVEKIGDCITPRSWWAAVTEGYQLGCRL